MGKIIEGVEYDGENRKWNIVIEITEKEPTEIIRVISKSEILNAPELVIDNAHLTTKVEELEAQVADITKAIELIKK